MAASAARSIGIDFGASACRVAAQTGAATAVYSVPALGGREAKRQLGMQLPGVDARATEILKSAKAAVEEALGARISGAMIAAPPSYSDRQKAALKACAAGAGFRNVGLVDESIAAAVYHMSVTGRRGLWLVYGLGKATFYTTLLDTAPKLDVKAHAGDLGIGGDDLDARLVDDFRRRGLASAGVSGELLGVLAERLKRLLSYRETAIIEDFVAPEDPPVTLCSSRGDFEALIEPALRGTFEAARFLTAEARVGNRVIERVLLVGGSTRIPLVERKIREVTAAEIERSPSEAVSRGAAILASQLGDCFQPGQEAPAPPPATERPPENSKVLAAYDNARRSSGAEMLRRYYGFLDEARAELAFYCKQEAAVQIGRGREKDALEILDEFLEWKSASGRSTVTGKVADLYYQRAVNNYRFAASAKSNQERREALKTCRANLNKCLGADPQHREAIHLKGKLP